MPKSVFDMETVNGRLAFARDQAGFNQIEFGRLMGYSSRTGWPKIERGENTLTADHVGKAAKILGLDVRYFYGQIDYREAGNASPKTYHDFIAAVGRSAEGDDPVVRAVRDKQGAHHRLVQMTLEWSPDMVRRLVDAAYFYFSGGGGDPPMSEQAAGGER